MKNFESLELQLLGEAEEIEIETLDPGTQTQHRVPVWVVIVAGDAYVRSVNGRQGHWYQQLSASPHGTVYADERCIPIQATPVLDLQRLEQVSEAYWRKYAHYPQDVAWIVGPSAQATTMQLRPRDLS